MNHREYRITLAFLYGTIDTIPSADLPSIRANLLSMEWDYRLGEPPHGWDKMPPINTGLRRIFRRYDEKLRYVDALVRHMGDRVPLKVSRQLLKEIERSKV